MDQNLPPQPVTFPSAVSQSGTVSGVEPAPTPTSPDQKAKNSLFNSVWFWGLTIFSLNLATILWFLVYPKVGAVIDISDQRITNRIYVNKVKTVETAALAIVYVGSGDVPGRVIAYTGMLPANTYRDFNLSITDYLTTTEDELLKDFKPGTLLIANLYRDVDGDGQFDAEVDTEPIKDFFGESLQISFTTQ